jgi:flavin-dependent dehydrogenase
MSEVAIVGGGLAGAYAAALLAREGSPTLVLEREAGPHDKVCGEFLSSEAQAYLRAAGLELDRLGAVSINRVRVAAGARLTETRLPFTALGVSRRRLDEALLQLAERLGARVRRGVSVRSLHAGRLETSAGPLNAGTIVLGSGKHDVRGAKRTASAADWGMIGFKTHLRLSQSTRRAIDGAVEIVLFEGGYAGLQLVEDDRANLCLLVRRDHFAAIGQNWAALLSRLMEEPHLSLRLADAAPLHTQPLAVAAIPFGFLRRRVIAPSVFPIGDQAAVIASFTGDGMAIALHTARLAARAIARGETAEAYHSQLGADLARPVRLASWLQRRAETWPGRDLGLLGLGCFPSALAHIASWTRVPRHALVRAGLPAAA